MTHKNYQRESMTWEETKDPEYPYSAKVKQDNYLIRLNDFPDENLYTLIVNNKEIEDLEDWPERWIISSTAQDQSTEQQERVRKTIPLPELPFSQTNSRVFVLQYIRDLRRRLTNQEEFAEPGRIADPTSSDLRQLLREGRVKVVHKFISELKSNRDVDVVVRYCINEEDKEKICSDLGLTPAAFNTILSRARKRLKELRSSHS